jgi:hypothetical protein
MPYKSDAQRRFFHSKGAKDAGITKADVNKWDKESKGMKLNAYASLKKASSEK